MEGLKVLRPRHSNRRPMIAIAPGDIILALHLYHARVVAINPLTNLRVGAGEFDLLRADIPLDTILTEAYVQTHTAALVIHSEYPSKAILVWHYGTIEYAIAVRCLVTTDHRVLAIAPEYLL